MPHLVRLARGLDGLGLHAHAFGTVRAGLPDVMVRVAEPVRSHVAAGLHRFAEVVGGAVRVGLDMRAVLVEAAEQVAARIAARLVAELADGEGIGGAPVLILERGGDLVPCERAGLVLARGFEPGVAARVVPREAERAGAMRIAAQDHRRRAGARVRCTFDRAGQPVALWIEAEREPQAHRHRAVVVDRLVAFGFLQPRVGLFVLAALEVAVREPVQRFPAVIRMQRGLRTRERRGHRVACVVFVVVRIERVAGVVVAPDLVQQPVLFDRIEVRARVGRDERADVIVRAAPARLHVPDERAHREEQLRVDVQRRLHPVPLLLTQLLALDRARQRVRKCRRAGDRHVGIQPRTREHLLQFGARGFVVGAGVQLQFGDGPAALAHELRQPLGFAERRHAREDHHWRAPHRRRERQRAQRGDERQRRARMRADPAGFGHRFGPAAAAVFVGPVVPVMRFAQPRVRGARVRGLPRAQAREALGAGIEARLHVGRQRVDVPPFGDAIVEARGERGIELRVERGELARAQQRVDVANEPAGCRGRNQVGGGGGHVGIGGHDETG
ncbi:Uncharacterised protein [Burkholderia cenocepacia]|nr:Uncharacterised protein [Burkholderia cenocepacia]